jgi:hypothetical protein
VVFHRSLGEWVAAEIFNPSPLLGGGGEFLNAPTLFKEVERNIVSTRQTHKPTERKNENQPHCQT